MTYAAVDTASRTVRADGDRLGVIGVGLLKKAAVTINASTDRNDTDARAARAIIDGTAPAAWTTMVLYLLDTSGQLTAPTDAQVDTAVNTAWTYITKSR